MRQKRDPGAAAGERRSVQPRSPLSCNFSLPCQQTADAGFSPLLQLTNTGEDGGGITVTTNADAGAFPGIGAYCGGMTGNVMGAVTGYSPNFDAVFGWSTNHSGVRGMSTNYHGVFGHSDNNNGMAGVSDCTFASGVYGENLSVSPTGQFSYGVAGRGGEGPQCVGVCGDLLNYNVGYGAYFNGQVHITSIVNTARSGFHIDHPLEPESKYLNHSSVESSDLKNMYDGVVTLNPQGSAWVELPSWFGLLNRDFRYQLTPIGSYAPVYIAQEIADNKFQIGGGKSGQRVSWLVTGIRRDVWAEKNPMSVEEDKDSFDRGKLLHPLEAGQPKEMGISYSRIRGLETMAQHQERLERERKSRTG